MGLEGTRAIWLSLLGTKVSYGGWIVTYLSTLLIISRFEVVSLQLL